MSKTMMTAGMVLAGVAVGALIASNANAQPEGFEATTIISGLVKPTNLEFSPDGRLFVAEQSGLLKVFDDVSDRSPDTVADLRESVHAVGGRGLLGLALDPDFPATPDVYVMYTHDAAIGGTAPTWGDPGGTQDRCRRTGKCIVSGRISRLVLSGGEAVSETVIVEDWCAEWNSHSVGDLRFGPDGALYASAGDGAFFGQPDWGQRSGINGCGDPPTEYGGVDQPAATGEGGALRSQDLRTSGDPAGLSGSIIRIDKHTGDALPGNPNFGDPDPNVARIVAYGLRNPYRTTFRPGTDELWVADVGWNDWEEINVIDGVPAEVINFGWPCFEGPDLGYDIGSNLCADLMAEGPSAVQGAYYQYMQSEPVSAGEGCVSNSGSPSALSFYTGGTYPDEYDGAFFFGDYSRGCVWSMLAGSDGRPDPATARTMLTDIAVTDLERGPGGDIFALDIFGPDGQGGRIVRLAYPDGGSGPTARIAVDVTSGPTPLLVSFDAGASTADGTLAYDWDLDGDGTFGDANGATVEHTYNAEGRFNAQVKVTDPDGRFDTALQVISAGTPPTVTIDHPDGTASWAVDDELSFAGGATDGSGDAIPAGGLRWELLIHHCETITDCHTHNEASVEGATTGSFVAPEHDYPSFVEIAVTATSASGLSTTESVELHPQTALLTVDGSPSGVDAGFNGKTVSTPSTHEVIFGSTSTVSAPAEQSLGGSLFDFADWSDGGARTHDVTVVEDVTVTANFEERVIPTIHVDDVVVTERTGSKVTARVPVRLSVPHTKSVSVRAKQAAGTAALGSDVVKWASRTVRFSPGSTERWVDVVIQGDNVDELDEQFFLLFSNPVNAPLPDDRAQVTIIDDDATPVVTVRDVSVSEGTGSGTRSANFSFRLDGRSDRPVTVDVSTVDGSATGGADFEAFTDRVVTFAPLSTRRNLTVRVVRDSLSEGDEHAILRLTNPVNATVDDDEVMLTIVDDEPKLSVRDVTVSEGVRGQRNARFIVRLSKSAAQPVTVEWTTVDGTATSGSDYVAGSGRLTIARGRTTGLVTVKVNGDQDPEPTEAFIVRLSDAVGAAIDDGEATGTIASDDYEPVVSIADASKVEGATSMRFVLTLDEAAATSVKVTFQTADGSAQAPDDYRAKGPLVVTFSAGSTRRTITVPIRQDRLDEGDETFEVRLSDPIGLVIGAGVGTGTIIDND